MGRGEFAIARLSCHATGVPSCCENCGVTTPGAGTPLLMRSRLFADSATADNRAQLELAPSFGLLQGLKKLSRRSGAKHELDAALVTVARLMLDCVRAIVRAGRDPSSSRPPCFQNSTTLTNAVHGLASLQCGDVNAEWMSPFDADCRSMSESDEEALESMNADDDDTSSPRSQQIHTIRLGLDSLRLTVYGLSTDSYLGMELDEFATGGRSWHEEESGGASRRRYTVHHSRTEHCALCASQNVFVHHYCDHVPIGLSTKVDQDILHRIETFLTSTAANPSIDLIQYVNSCLRDTPEPALNPRERLGNFIALVRRGQVEFEPPPWLKNRATPATTTFPGYNFTISPHAAAFERIAVRAGVLKGMRVTMDEISTHASRPTESLNEVMFSEIEGIAR